MTPPKPKPSRSCAEMSAEEARRWVDKARRDVWWQEQSGFSLRLLSSLEGWGEARNQNPHVSFFRKLGRIIGDIESRKIIFTKGGEDGKPPYVMLEPPEVPPRLWPLAVLRSWSLFARCMSCYGNQFMPVMAGGKEHVACYHCIPPSRYGTIGATAVNTKLIAEAIKPYYYVPSQRVFYASETQVQMP